METYEALFDFDRAVAAIRSLDAAPEDKAVVARELKRLAEKRRKLDSGPTPPWSRGHK
jgi:hypothetical protein